MTRNKPANVIPTVYVTAIERDPVTGKKGKSVSTTLYETTAQAVIDFLNEAADRGDAAPKPSETVASA